MVSPSSPCSIESNRHHFYLDYEALTVLDVWEGRVGGSSELVSVELAAGSFSYQLKWSSLLNGILCYCVHLHAYV